jgi:hypothetical protein
MLSYACLATFLTMHMHQLLYTDVCESVHAQAVCVAKSLKAGQTVTGKQLLELVTVTVTVS